MSGDQGMWRISRPLVNDELLKQDKVLESELAVAAAEEGK